MLAELNSPVTIIKTSIPIMSIEYRKKFFDTSPLGNSPFLREFSLFVTSNYFNIYSLALGVKYKKVLKKVGIFFNKVVVKGGHIF